MLSTELWSDPIWEMMNWMSAPLSELSAGLKNNGIKHIRRPHNLITRKDKDGNVTGYSLETVYTPFKKEDVKTVVCGNKLTVQCGKENKEKTSDMVHCGVSYQSYEFSLTLSDAIDAERITANAEDGMLRIELPLKKVITATPVPRVIPVM